MLLNHVGIINKSQEHAVRFYKDFLGFEITKHSVVTCELSEQLFEISRDISMLAFEKSGIKIEVFIIPEYVPPSSDLRHIGFLLDDFNETLDKAKQEGINVIVGKTEEKTVYFVKDYSGNLIEIKKK